MVRDWSVSCQQHIRGRKQSRKIVVLTQCRDGVTSFVGAVVKDDEKSDAIISALSLSVVADDLMSF